MLDGVWLGLGGDDPGCWVFVASFLTSAASFFMAFVCLCVLDGLDLWPIL